MKIEHLHIEQVRAGVW